MTESERYELIDEHLTMSIQALRETFTQIDNINKAALLIIDALKKGGKILLCGNGGSAADAQHIAAELMGRYKVDRNPLPAIALTTDTSALTAIANDYGYEDVFERQAVGLGRPGDCLIAISTSGTSANVINAMRVCAHGGIEVIGLTGDNATGKERLFYDYCTICIKVPSTNTPIIQQCHITIGHIICALVEKEFTK